MTDIIGREISKGDLIELVVPAENYPFSGEAFYGYFCYEGCFHILILDEDTLLPKSFLVEKVLYSNILSKEKEVTYALR